MYYTHIVSFFTGMLAILVFPPVFQQGLAVWDSFSPFQSTKLARRVPRAFVVEYDASIFRDFDSSAGGNASINSTITATTTAATFATTTAATTNGAPEATSTPAPGHKETHPPDFEVDEEDPHPSLYDLLVNLLTILASVEIDIFEIFEEIADDYAILHQRQLDLAMAIRRFSMADTVRMRVTEMVSYGIAPSDSNIYAFHEMRIWFLNAENEVLHAANQRWAAAIAKAAARIAKLEATVAVVDDMKGIIAKLSTQFADDHAKYEETEGKMTEMTADIAKLQTKLAGLGSRSD